MNYILMSADPLRGQEGGGWALWNGIEPLGECHLGPKKLEIFGAQPTPPPLAQVMDLYRQVR